MFHIRRYKFHFVFKIAANYLQILHSTTINYNVLYRFIIVNYYHKFISIYLINNTIRYKFYGKLKMKY